MNDRLFHLTCNTGHVAATPRGDVAPEVIDQLLPVLDGEGGPVPGMPGWHIHFFTPRAPEGQIVPGGAAFQIAQGPGLKALATIIGVTCWHADMNALSWEMVQGGYSSVKAPLKQAGMWRPLRTVPPPLPWLAVWMFPTIGLCDHRTVSMLGDLERCIAWTLMEAAP